ncbi:hypothetical protein [endosymbiont GvMRE of Glomus versiforme]|uniref:hypothetical protein n=1 Tax=endosymbiont GvMRE of Glomus versiforme TaxID=2039283 RepID=UPI000EC70ACF|nr:hypothetical protein [endosymbiont GvMRE of Glomus versiforme]RHZ35712.1 Serine/threonine protein kinase [endosymbiont GvMRE of Glomus versiforme]
MINAQEWLNQNYPNQNQTISIDAKNKDLVGNLIIKDFPNLEKIEVGNNKNLTTIELSNLPKLNYFQTNNCQLTSITINNCPNIAYFNAGNNLLTNTKFLNNLGSEKLNHLSIHSNNFEKQGLGFASKFTNLEELYIDNSNEEKFDQKICNRFYGSLEPLQSLKKLQWLGLAKTDIDSGLEYLPISIKKIGCKKDWSPSDNSGCAKICRELEKAAQIEGVTERLIQEEKNEPLSARGKATWYRLAPWRQAWNLLGEEEFRKQISQQSAQAWLDKYYPKQASKEQEKRENISFLNNISGKNLTGHLDLSDFANLEGLNCSWNQLTSLNLSKCKNLTKLNCSGNKFTSTDFLSEIPNKEKLRKLKLSNNELKENLNFLASFTELVELDIRDCPFYGSLEPLQKLNNLERVLIGNTHVSEGLEHLPNNCKEIYCDTSDYKYKSMEIVKELGKFLKGRYYDVSKWKEDKQNKTVAVVIPLERLFVIRSNIKKFLNKWGKDAEDDWYERNKKKFFNYWKKPQLLENRITELSNLQAPEEFNSYWYTGGIKWVARAGAVTGGILSLTEYPELGGALAATFPFVEVVASQIEQNLYDDKEKKWNEFLADSGEFLDNYHELLGIMEQIKKNELGKVNQALNSLRDQTKAFLEKYDEDDNGVIDISELIEKRKELGTDLSKEKAEEENSQLGDIVLAIKGLEREVTAYRQGSETGEVSQPGNQEVESQQHEVVEIQSFEQQAQIIQKEPFGIPGSSKK